MIKNNFRWMTAIFLAASLVVSVPASLFAGDGQGGNDPADKYKTTTPIKHIVIIFQTNRSITTLEPIRMPPILRAKRSSTRAPALPQ